MNYWSLLTSRHFLPQFLTQFLGACNDNIFKNAVIILIVFQLADTSGGNAPLLVALATGLFILPFFLCSLTAGQIADKYRKSTLILQIKLAEVFLMIGAALGFYWQSVPVLMVTLLLLGAQAAFFGPLKYAILPELLAEDDLITGNGITGAATFIAILVGTIIGALFIMAPNGRLIISSTLIILACIGYGTAWFIPMTTYTNPKQTVNINALHAILELGRFAHARKTLFLSIIGISWFWLYGATLLSIFPSLTKTILHGDESVVTLFMAMFSIGIALGSVLYTKLAKTKVQAKLVCWSLLGLTLFTADLSWSTSHPFNQTTLITVKQFLSDSAHYRIIVDACCVAIFGGLYTVPLYTLLQSRTPHTHRARIIAFNNIMNALFMIVSAASLMGLSSISCSLSQNVLILAIATGVITLYFFRHQNRIT